MQLEQQQMLERQLMQLVGLSPAGQNQPQEEQRLELEEQLELEAPRVASRSLQQLQKHQQQPRLRRSVTSLSYQ